ncbi:zinc finger protein RFP-like isoform X4 [Chelonia mydas]|uniref:zinc finger protein RFP-like isoform X4 n=1 Tax=Chelonia mydas TaxID=8469 RepID=UPI0018A1DDE2|nr:zinc finger protein RFP-like isoform X4 [Chelonia mydas]
MAAASPVESLQEEATCPVCLEYFTDPVTLECGHNFCRACIAQCWEGPDTAASCPQCRETVQQRNLRPNRQLANILEIAKRLSFQAAKGAGGGGVCGEHQEALKLFCEEDQTPICVVCDRSRAHRAHRVVPIQEAAQEYKKQTETERQKIVSEFQQLRQLLEEQERLLLAQLEKLDKEIVKIQNENITKLSEGISHLSELIREMEGKCQKPASGFLQDVRSTLSRCEKGKFQQPEEISPELEERVSDFSQKTIVLTETLRKFKDTLPSALETQIGESLGAHRQANVTLDPDTAHPHLVQSEGGKSVRWGDMRQRLPNNPERFDTEHCVLGCEGFTSGRHCWEVEIGGGQRWAVGVARESVGRKGRISLSPERGIWAVGQWGDQFWALTSPVTLLSRSRAPSRIRVCLDCGRAQVTFIDAGDEAPIFTFPPGSVPGERIRPWLGVGPGSRLRLCP